jgi:hypothetical protein
VRLYTRNGYDFADRFPRIVKSLPPRLSEMRAVSRATKLRVSENMTERSRAARSHRRRVAADRGAFVGSLKMPVLTPFLEFALLLVVPGALVILLIALFLIGRT